MEENRLRAQADAAGKRPRATLISTVKNEGPYLWEWLAYHLVIGFTDFIIYQRDSDDLSHEILSTLRRVAPVRYRLNRAQGADAGMYPFKNAPKEPEYRDADWIMALDLDEFLVMKTPQGTLASVWHALTNCDQVIVNWKIFGSSGHQIPPSDLVLKSFTWADDTGALARHPRPYKTLYRKSMFESPGVYRPSGYTGTGEIATRNGSGLRQSEFEIDGIQSTDPGLQRLLQINHYMVRDASSFVLKAARGHARKPGFAPDRDYWEACNRNIERDVSVQRLLPAVRAKMNELDTASRGRLARLSNFARDRHLGRIRSDKLPESLRQLHAYTQTHNRLSP